MPNMQSVASSNIAAIGYDEDTRTLYVDFNHGGSYQYFNVPQEVYEEFLSASSPGTFLHSEIKGKYAYSTA